MKEIVFIILVCMYPATLFGAALAYMKGYINGMKKL